MPTRFQRFDRELKRRGWHYDVSEDGFYDEYGRRLNWHRLIRLLPDMTLYELVSYQDDRWDKLPGPRKVAKAMNELAERAPQK